MSKRLFVGLTLFLSLVVVVNIYAETKVEEGSDSKLENFSHTIYTSIKE